MKKSILDRITSLFADETVFVDVKTKDGRIFRVGSDPVAVDATVKEVTADGVVDIEDDSYTMEDGTVATIVEGVITELNPAVETETEDVTTESMKFAVVKQISKWEMTVDQDKFEVGSQVTMTDSEGNTYNAYSGTYELEDGRLITLDENGIILLIADPEGVVTDVVPVGQSIDGTTQSTDDTETMAAIEKLADEVSKIRKENAELKEKLSKTPTAQHTSTTVNFSEQIQDTKPKSKLHAMMK